MIEPSGSQQFRGDGEGLVELWISASQIPAVARTAKPDWVGRPLQKWCDGSACDAVLEPLENRNRRTTVPDKFPQLGPGKLCRGRKSGTALKSHHDQVQDGPRCQYNGQRFACPALAASPKPEALPMPVTLLRGRSPSPPKDTVDNGYATQQLVQPVAA